MCVCVCCRREFERYLSSGYKRRMESENRRQLFGDSLRAHQRLGYQEEAESIRNSTSNVESIIEMGIASHKSLQEQRERMKVTHTHTHTAHMPYSHSLHVCVCVVIDLCVFAVYLCLCTHVYVCPCVCVYVGGTS